MKLFFQNANGKERTIAEVANEEEAMREIKKFCAERDYIIPYTRGWVEDGRAFVDVGSHSEFFIIEE